MGAKVLRSNAHVLDRFARTVSLQYADIVYNGLWFTPLRHALDAFVDSAQERVTGVVRLKLFKGRLRRMAAAQRDSKGGFKVNVDARVAEGQLTQTLQDLISSSLKSAQVSVVVAVFGEATASAEEVW